jgi:hypothetical protein
LKEERAMLLEEWLNKEVSFGDLGDVSLVQKKAPRKVKRKRPIPTEDGSTLGYGPLFCSFILALFFHNGCLCIFSIRHQWVSVELYTTSILFLLSSLIFLLRLIVRLI